MMSQCCYDVTVAAVAASTSAEYSAKSAESATVAEGTGAEGARATVPKARSLHRDRFVEN